MTSLRKQCIIWLFEMSQNFYIIHFKTKHVAWNITKDTLLTYPKNTFGYRLGCFLKEHHFELIPKIERHDCYHVLTGYSTKVEDEIALQYLCYGNGKRSLYLYGVLILGTILLPEHFNYYLKSYHIGKKANRFHSFNYFKLLNTDFNVLRTSIFIPQNSFLYEKAV